MATMPKTSFTTKLKQALGTSKRPAVKVAINGYTYRSTVAVMGGTFMVGVAAEHRAAAAGVEGGDTVKVTLEPDTEPRVTPVPPDLAKALAKAKLTAAFDAAAPSRRKEFVRSVDEAKTPETRERRIQKVIDALQTGADVPTAPPPRIARTPR